jgi:multiple sugar transport system ATP-binding protein
MGELTIQNLSKVFDDDSGQILAVDDLNLEIEDGEFVVFVGPSGCGKSTTLRSIAGLETVSEGRIFLDDDDITTQPPTERDIAMVFQNYALYPHMTAGENMAFGLKMSTDLSRDEISQRVNETAEMMGIEDLLEKRPGELSGGQQQRVALGRAIVREPEVFLMDEPLSNLDAKLRTQMRTELQNLQHKLGITTIYVTHDQTEAMTMGDRIVILDGGELQQVGTPLECYHEPTNQFVAGFIGDPAMNFFTMSYENGVLHHDEFTYQLSPSLQQQLGTLTGDVVMGVRPESIKRADGSGESTLIAPVSVVEPMGDVTHVYFEIDDQTYTMTQEGDLVTEVGSQIELHFPEEKIHLFDAATGDAIKTGSVSATVETDQAVEGSDTGRP